MRTTKMVMAMCAGLVMSGCWLKIDVGDPDGSLPDASSPDASTPERPPTCKSPLVLPEYSQAQMMGPIQLQFEGCAASASVVAPDGSDVSARVTVTAGQTTVQFAAILPGLFGVSLASADGGPGAHTAVEVIERIAEDGGILVRYADRIDVCGNGPMLSDEGRLFCQRDSTTWVYEADGGLLTSFPGLTTVLNSEVWTWLHDNTVEHRTDTPTELRFDGALKPVWVEVLSGRSFTETQPGYTMRLIPNGAQQITWDGAQLSGRVFENLQTTSGHDYVVEEDGLWAEDTLCRYTPGCANTLCPAIEECPFGRASVIGSSRGAVWVKAQDSIALWSRPLASRQVLHGPRPIPTVPEFESVEFWGTDADWHGRGAYLTVSRVAQPWTPVPRRTLVVREDANGFHFALAPDNTYPQGKWILTIVDPYTLRLTPN